MLSQENTNNIDSDLKNRLQTLKPFFYSTEIRHIIEVSKSGNSETWDPLYSRKQETSQDRSDLKSLNHLWRPLSLSNSYIDKLR